MHFRHDICITQQLPGTRYGVGLGAGNQYAALIDGYNCLGGLPVDNGILGGDPEVCFILLFIAGNSGNFGTFSTRWILNLTLTDTPLLLT